MSDYYKAALKKHRQSILSEHSAFSVMNDKLETSGTLRVLLENVKPEAVYHLAGQAGLRHSIDAPPRLQHFVDWYQDNYKT